MAVSCDFESDCRHFDPRPSAAIQGLLALSSVQFELSQPKYISLHQVLTSTSGGLSAFVSKRTGSRRGVLECGRLATHWYQTYHPMRTIIQI